MFIKNLKIKISLILLFTLLFNLLSLTEPIEKPSDLSSKAIKWVEKNLKKMTLEEKIGQMVMVPFSGIYSNINGEYFSRLKNYIRNQHVGGFIMFGGEIYEAAVIMNELQKETSIPLIFTSDFERGAGNQLGSAVSFPTNMAIGATRSEEYAYFQGKITALEARTVGIHWTYAPVMDVNSNPDNPIINIRSYGEDPELVSRLGAAFIRGCQDNGLIATAKHFPGHGDTSLDSHTTLAFIPADRDRLEKVELVPFKAAIKAGVRAIMTAHIALPQIEMENIPATISSKILNGLLRDELGFNGLIVTDAMNMGGIINNYWVGEAAIKAVKAGVDMVLMPPDPVAAIKAIMEALKKGEISEKRIDESVRRILEAKTWLGLHKNRFVNIERINKTLADIYNMEKVSLIANDSITLVKNDDNIIPVDPRSKKRLLALSILDEPDPKLSLTFLREIKNRYEFADTEVLDSRTNTSELIAILDKAKQYDIIICAVFVRTRAWKNTIALPDQLANFIRLLSFQGKPIAVISFSNPYIIRQLPEIKNYMCVYGYSDILQQAASRAVFGEITIKGKLPVSIPGLFQIGAGIEVPRLNTSLITMSQKEAGISEEGLKNAYSVIEEAVKDKAFPGGVLAIGRKGGLVALKAFGSLSYDKESHPVSIDTIYDLASLTKVIVTTTASMKLYEDRKLKLDAEVSSFIPEFAQNGKEKITIRQLLTHSSGLPAYKQYFLDTKGKERIIQRICEEKIEYAPETKSVYSDLGIILVGEIIERLTGESLDKYIKRTLFDPLEMNSTMYNPPKSLLLRSAPTENDPWRNKVVHGEVHDENAYAMGGVSGHAGLFSTAYDIARFCQMMLNGGLYDHKRILEKSTIELFTKKQINIPETTRALGWDTPSPTGSSGGRFLSEKAYGHTGFTGTSIWIDPEKELFVVFLTNRVHPTRENNKIKEVRPKLHDAIIKSIEF